MASDSTYRVNSTDGLHQVDRSGALSDRRRRKRQQESKDAPQEDTDVLVDIEGASDEGDDFEAPVKSDDEDHEVDCYA